MPDATDPGAKFTMAEPVVTAGASTATAIALTGALMQLAEAYDWQHFTTQQSTAIYGLVGIVVGIGSAMLARAHVTPDHKVEQQVLDAWVATPPGKVVVGQSSGTMAASYLPLNPTIGQQWSTATPTEPELSYGDQLVADAIAAQQLAGTQPTVTNIDDVDPGHHAGGIMDGTVADPFLT